MAIGKDYINFLFDTMKYYDSQYNETADSCYAEIGRALNEICSQYLNVQNVKVLPYGSYTLKSNYQVVEPMEYYLILPADKQLALQKEEAQTSLQRKKKSIRKKNSIKNVYKEIMDSTPTNTCGVKGDYNAFDVAGIVMREMQKYLGQEDKIYYKNNVVFIKLHASEDIIFSVNIFVAYDFDASGINSFSKLGYKMNENLNQTIVNIQQKNVDTKGNYLLLCKLIKMLELELVIGNMSNIYLSNKSLFVENVIYNVPNKFFSGKDFSLIFTRIVNYLMQLDEKNILIPDGTSTKMFDTNWYYADTMFSSFLRKIKYIDENCDQMIDEAIDKENQKKVEEKTDEEADKDKKPVEPIKKIKK